MPILRNGIDKMKQINAMKFSRTLTHTTLGLLLLASGYALAEPISSKSLPETQIFGHHPYMNSIGTLMYRADSEGNRGALDENGKRVPTVGSIIGFKDLFCDANSESVVQFGSEWKPFFDYADIDEDICETQKPHLVEWFIIDTPDIAAISSWQQIESNATSINQAFPDAIIAPKSTFTFPSNPKGPLALTVPISGNVTSSVRVPEAAVGKYIGVKYTPLSATGLPLVGKAVELYDLNHFYKQTPPTGPGLVGIDLIDESLGTSKGDENNYLNGSGGGKVQAAIERPAIKNFSISGIMSPGQSLDLAYDFIPYPTTQPDVTDNRYDKSVFFWGELDTTLIRSEFFDERKTVAENNQLGSQFGRITQGRTVTLTLKDVGSFIEVTTLPMRQAPTETWPVTGAVATYELTDFSETITPVKRPNISNLSILGIPKVGSSLSAKYTYTPSNSTQPYDASIFRWSYDANGNNITIIEGTVKTDINAIPDYTQPVMAPNSGAITLEQLGVPEVTTEMAGNTIRIRIDAVDGLGLTGNWAEANTAPVSGTPNDMFAIKLVEYEYGGTFPLVREYGKGFPSTGFTGATFRLFAEDLNVATNQNNWDWTIVENGYYAKVNKTGMVTLLRIPPKDGVIRVIAINKKDPTLIRSHSFSINKWLISFKELSNGPKGYNINNAAQLCDNFTRNDVSEVFLPSVPDYTSLTADPNNPSQSKGAHVRSAGWNTIYSFPSEDFYSQWGELDVYKSIDRTQWIFPEIGTPYTWTRDTQETTGLPIFAAPTGWADWFVAKNGNFLLNTACIAYADNFIPEIPTNIDGYMMGIKLTYSGYPQNNKGFPTIHEPGEGYPTLGFNGATFILFAQDGPGSPFFIANNTANNVNWDWQIEGGMVAAVNKPSKNDYAMVSFDGRVTLLAMPPKGTVIKVTAKNGNLTRTHSFTLNKWLYSYADLNVPAAQSLKGAQAVCSVGGYRVPRVDEYTAMKADPKNPEQSLGFGQREAGGWSIIYNFPSNDYYSQWGELDVFFRYDPKTGTASPGVWAHNDYWSSSLSLAKKPITARISGWGDWLSFTGDANTALKLFACIEEARDPIIPAPPSIKNIIIKPDLTDPDAVKLTANYVYVEGVSRNTTDASTFIWYKNGVALGTAKPITVSTQIDPITLSKSDVNGSFRLVMRAKDVSGQTASNDVEVVYSLGRPIISNLVFTPNVNNLVPDVTISATYLFSKSYAGTIDKSSYVWTVGTVVAGSGDIVTTGTVPGYTIKPADVGKTIKLDMTAIDNIGLVGNKLSITTATMVNAIQAPTVSNVTITPQISTGGAVTLTGTYKFNGGFSSNPADASTFVWYKNTAAVSASEVVPSTGKVKPYNVATTDVNAIFKLAVRAKDASGLSAQSDVTKEFQFSLPQITNLAFDSRASNLTAGNSFNAKYTFVPSAANTLDRSVYLWTGSTVSIAQNIVTSGTVPDYLIKPEDAGRMISLTMTPVDNIGLRGPIKSISTAQAVTVKPPAIRNINITGNLTTGSALTATYEFVAGQSFDTRDASTYRWIGQNAAFTNVAAIRISGEVDAYVINRADSGKTITLEMTPKDVASATTGVIGKIETQSVTADYILPEVRNAKFFYYQGINVGDDLGASYQFIAGSNATDNSVTRLFKASGNTDWTPNLGSGAVQGYRIQSADAGSVIRLEIQARDGANRVGNTISTETGIIASNAPTVDSVSITAPTIIRTGDILKGQYRFKAGSNATDKSTYTWKGFNTTQLATVTTSGQVDDYKVLPADVGYVVTLTVNAIDGADVTGNSASATTSTVVLTNAPTVSNVKIFYFAGVKVGDKLGGSYRFTPGSINSDKSTYVWKGASTTTPTLNTGSSNGVGSVGPYTIQPADAGKVVQLVVTAKDGTLTGNTAQDQTSTVPLELFSSVNFAITKTVGVMYDPLYGTILGKVTGKVTWAPNGLTCNVSDWQFRWLVDGVPMAGENAWKPNAGGAKCIANGLDLGDHMLIPLVDKNSPTNSLVTSQFQYELKYLPTGKILRSNVVN